MGTYIHIMTITLGPVDYALIALMLATLPLDGVLSGRLRRRVETGEAGARTHAYWVIIGLQWASCLVVLGLWIATARPWSALLLGPVEPLRLGLGLLAAAIGLLPALNMRRRVFKRLREEGAQKLRFAPGVDWLMPQTPGQRRLWAVASISAGCCEEVVCRGYLLAFVAHFCGIWFAVPVSAIVFGLGHVYQGKAGVIMTTIWGFTAALIAVASGSLVPVIIMHVLQDLLSGDLGYRIARARTEYAAA